MLLSKYLHTLRYLKFIQIVFRVIYYFCRTSRLPSGARRRIRAFSLSIDGTIESDCYHTKNAFIFLNKEKDFRDTIEWNFQRYGKLWSYHLNYFDFLNNCSCEREEGIRIIKDFIAHTRINWVCYEPYVISQRGINWIKFLSRNKVFDYEIIDHLYRQYKLLMRRLEYHLLGNHLLDNAFSLLFCAFFFKDTVFYRKAKKILYRQLREQILPDGAHFELSPMYHQIVLFRLLDSINLLLNNKGIIRDDSLLDFLKGIASDMLIWLNSVTFSNGNIPLVNDAMYGAAPTTNELKDYARSLSVKQFNRLLARKMIESGYRKIAGLNYEMLIDVGNIGPDYIPGHAHSDTLSFELYIRGNPFIVDTGTSTYENTDRRFLERSTKSHNTVMIDECEQTEVWSSFRVARRAKVLNLEESHEKICCSHDGYKRLGAVHRRCFFWDESSITILDTVESIKTHKYRAFFHFHPDIKVTIKNSVIEAGEVRINLEGKLSFLLSNYFYAPCFNMLNEAQLLIVEFDSTLETKILL